MNSFLALSRKIDDMRSFINLCERSDLYGDLAHELRSELHDKVVSIIGEPMVAALLEDKDLITSTLSKIGFEFGMTGPDKRRLAGLNPSFNNREMDDIDFFFQDMSDKARIREWRYRIGVESEILRAEGWYPFLLTLTVDPKLCDTRKFWEDGKAWKQFKQDMVDISGACYGSCVADARLNPTEYVRYAACLEHGESGDHNHSHVLLWMRAIPDSWKVCPNANRYDPSYTQCWHLKKYWKYGHSKMDYYRTQDDVWKELGFVYPNTIQSVMPDFNSGSYLCKYLTKEQKQWSHRFRATRNLGLHNLDSRLRNLPIDRLVQLMTHPPTLQILMKHCKNIAEPMRLIRKRVRRELLRRIYSTRQALPSALTEWTLRSATNIYQAFRSELNNSRLPSEIDSSQLYVLLRGLIPDVVPYEEDTFSCAMQDSTSPRRLAVAVSVI